MNPGAGRADRAERVLSDDPRFEPRATPPDRLPASLREEVARDTPRVLVAGGDGTAAAAAGVLAGTGVELAILPGGTLNHFARDHGVPTDPQAALELAARGTSKAADVAYLNDRLFLNTSSLGVYVDLARYRDRFRPRLGYVLTLAFSLAIVFVRMRSFRVRIRFDDRWRHYHTPLVFVGVDERDLSFSGFGSRAATGQRGLHVIALQGKARRRMLAIAVATATRGIREVARTPRADSELVEECTIEVEGGGVEVALDGEAHRIDPPFHYRLVRETLRVVAVPPAAAES